jgi:SAM-dependent methyltransferase
MATAPPPLGPFAPARVRQHKRRARAGFAQAAFLHQQAAADLADRLEAIPRRFERVLALGGGGLFSAEISQRRLLQTRLGGVLETDIGGGAVELDPERLPFGDGVFDLVVSPLTLHWVNDLPGTFIQIRRALKPDGLMLASVFGRETLSELRVCLIEAEAELSGGAGPRVSPFPDLQDLAGLLQRAGFALPAADRDLTIVRYREPMRLLADLRAMGETSALSEGSPRPLSRRILARTFEIYRSRFSDGDARVRASFEILTAAGWAPDASQPQPLKPGSASFRLADALHTQEQKAGEKTGR